MMQAKKNKQRNSPIWSEKDGPVVKFNAIAKFEDSGFQSKEKCEKGGQEKMYKANRKKCLKCFEIFPYNHIS